MEKKKKYKIKDLVLKFVSLVTEGANPEADVILVRATEEAIAKNEMPTTLFEEMVSRADPTAQERDLLWAEFKRCWQWADDPQRFLVDFSVSLGSILRGRAFPSTDTQTPTEQKVEDTKQEQAPEVTDVSLALDAVNEIERVRNESAEIERKLQERDNQVAELQRKLDEGKKAEIERKLDTEAREMGDVPGLNQEEVATLVRAMHKHEDIKVLVMRVISAAKTVEAEVGLTEEIGRTIPSQEIDERSELDRAVDTLLRSDPTITRPHAVSRVLAANPSLYTPKGQ